MEKRQNINRDYSYNNIFNIYVNKTSTCKFFIDSSCDLCTKIEKFQFLEDERKYPVRY